MHTHANLQSSLTLYLLAHLDTRSIFCWLSKPSPRQLLTSAECKRHHYQQGVRRGENSHVLQACVGPHKTFSLSTTVARSMPLNILLQWKIDSSEKLAVSRKLGINARVIGLSCQGHRFELPGSSVWAASVISLSCQGHWFEQPGSSV